ncbi:uncharacterized protein TNCV_475781 [Trichonephila clavipes]|nr:uncharacterized protein TNCV_475781 [Trichonephila clavipes]
MATSTNKTAAFGVKLIHKCMSKHRYIQKTDSLVRFMGWWNPSSKTMKATTLQSMSLVYAEKPQTLDHLEDNIRRVIADIRPQMLEKVIENWTSRLDYIRASHGSPMPDIIFKIVDVLAVSKTTIMRKRSATRELLATDHLILNHGQVTWLPPDLAPPLLTTTPHQREDVSALNRFSVHRCPTRRVFIGIGLELVTKPAMIRYPYYSATCHIGRF